MHTFTYTLARAHTQHPHTHTRRSHRYVCSRGERVLSRISAVATTRHPADSRQAATLKNDAVRGGDSANCSQRIARWRRRRRFSLGRVFYFIFLYFYFYQNAPPPSSCSVAAAVAVRVVYIIYCVYSVCFTVATRKTNDPSASARGPLAIDSRCNRGARPPVQAFRFTGTVSPDTRYILRRRRYRARATITRTVAVPNGSLYRSIGRSLVAAIARCSC